MLNVKEQRIYQETKPQYHPERDASVLEVRTTLDITRGDREAVPLLLVNITFWFPPDGKRIQLGRVKPSKANQS